MKRTTIRILAIKSRTEMLSRGRNMVRRKTMKRRYRRQCYPRKCPREVCRHHLLLHLNHLGTLHQAGGGNNRWICPALLHHRCHHQGRMIIMMIMITIHTNMIRRDTSRRPRHRNRRIHRRQFTPPRRREAARAVARVLIWPEARRRAVDADQWISPGPLQNM